MSVIADDPGAELRALRERAYGPGADILDDPAAIKRLRELEDAERAQLAAATGTTTGAAFVDVDTDDLDIPAPALFLPAREEPTVDAAGRSQPETAPDPTAAGADTVTPDASGDAASVEDDAAPGDTIPNQPDAPASTPWWRRRMPLLWAGSVVVAGVIGAAIALSLHAFGAGQVAVLNVDPDMEWPEGFFDPPPEGATAFEEFHGLVPVHLPQQMSAGATPSDCLYLAAPEADSFGFFSAACGAGPFPAAVAILVTADAPRELLEHYEPGTGLQFVLRGSQVRVYASAPAPGTTP